MEPEPEGSGGGPTPRGRQIPIARLAGERIMVLVEKRFVLSKFKSHRQFYKK